MISEISGDFLQWLRGFYQVAITGSVTRAAAIMHRTPSSITYQIQSLEQALGNSLITRSGNRLILTSAGRELLKWAIRTFDVVSALQGELACTDGVLRGVLSVAGMRPVFQMFPFLNTLRDFLQTYPKVRVELFPGDPDKLIRDLEMGMYDFAVLGVLSPPSTCVFQSFFTSPHMLIVAREHDFVLDDEPTREQLAEVPYIEFVRPHLDKDDAPRVFFPDVEMLFPKRANLRCSNRQTIMEYVAAGCGAAVVDVWSLLSTPQAISRVQAYSLEHYLPQLQYGLLMRKTTELTPPGKEFVRRLEHNMKNLELCSDSKNMIK
ncbi:LysR family transcriptional regulator [Mailhella massiliensis]|uniref:LysR family transcriptional regulator n=1 Tax=Mailhella massiliensis TaxID=1903261 RepID=UPI00097D045B|nr:LysR family transcriptional regulator [Mailhella massiliensis]